MVTRERKLRRRELGLGGGRYWLLTSFFWSFHFQGSSHSCPLREPPFFLPLEETLHNGSCGLPHQ